VWSPEQHHTPLIPKPMFDELTARRQANRGSRPGGGANAHPATMRSYLFRGMIRCGCGRRLFGTSRRNHTVTYYLCWPRKNNRGRPDTHAEHPKTVYLNEKTALDAVAAFYAERVFGPRRRELLAAELAGLDDHAGRQRAADRQRLTRALADIERRQANLLRQAQDGDPGDPFTTGLRQTYNQLEGQRRQTLTAITDLDQAHPEPDSPTPDNPGPGDAALLDALPYLASTSTAPLRPPNVGSTRSPA